MPIFYHQIFNFLRLNLNPIPMKKNFKPFNFLLSYVNPVPMMIILKPLNFLRLYVNPVPIKKNFQRFF